MRITRARSVTAMGGLFAATGFSRFANAAEFNFKLGHDFPGTHPIGLRTQEAADKIARESAGRIDLKIYHNGALGSATSQILQVRSGALEFNIAGDNILDNTSPVYAITSVPFTFTSYKDAWSAVDGALGKYNRAQLIKTTNIYPYETEWDFGFRQMVNGSHPVNGPDDLKGLKMRVPSSPMHVALYKAFGVAPAAVNVSEMYTALQTHLVDGVDLPLASIESYKVYEVQKYVALTNHVWTGATLIANADTLAKLPANLRAILERNLNAAAKLERGDIVRSETDLIAQLKGQGMSFTTPSQAAFKTLIREAGLYGQWRQSFGPDLWSLLERYTGKLG